MDDGKGAASLQIRVMTPESGLQLQKIPEAITQRIRMRQFFKPTMPKMRGFNTELLATNLEYQGTAWDDVATPSNRGLFRAALKGWQVAGCDGEAWHRPSLRSESESLAEYLPIHDAVIGRA